MPRNKRIFVAVRLGRCHSGTAIGLVLDMIGVTRRQYQTAKKKQVKGEALVLKNEAREYWDFYESELMNVQARNPSGWVAGFRGEVKGTEGFLGYKK